MRLTPTMPILTVVLSLGLAAPSKVQALQEPPADSVAVRPPASRSEGLAFLLSFGSGFVLLPGMGSFYAGNAGHGARHLLIGTVATGAFVVSMHGLLCRAYGTDGWCPLGASGFGWFPLTVAALLTYAANYVWSIGTAIEDAKGFNLRHRQSRAFGFQPAVINLPASSSPGSPGSRIGLGLTANF
jgi:hypothetical protein